MVGFPMSISAPGSAGTQLSCWVPVVASKKWTIDGKEATLAATAHSSIRYGYSAIGDGQYYEISLDSWGANAAFHFGVVNSLWTPSGVAGLGSSANAWAIIGNSGNKYHNGVSTSTSLGALTVGQIGQVFINNGKAWFGKNDTWLGDPSAGTGEVFSGLSDGPFYPALYRYNVNDRATIRTTSGGQTYSPPTGGAPLE